MNRIYRVASRTFAQSSRRSWCYVPVILLLIFVAFSWRRGSVSWHTLYRSTPGLFFFFAFPLIVCAGIVAEEVQSGRALLLHALGVTRSEFILGKLTGAVAYCVTLYALPQVFVVLCLFFSDSRFSARVAGLTFIYTALHFFYTSVLLVFFSTFVRSWGNSALLIGLQMCFAILVDAIGSEFFQESTAWTRGLKIFFGGPFRFAARAAGSDPVAPGEVALAVLFCAVFLVAAIAIYKRSEIGSQAARME